MFTLCLKRKNYKLMRQLSNNDFLVRRLDNATGRSPLKFKAYSIGQMLSNQPF